MQIRVLVGGGLSVGLSAALCRVGGETVNSVNSWDRKKGSFAKGVFSKKSIF